MGKMDLFLNKAIKNGASDLHFSTGEPTRVRIDGELTILDENVLDNETLTEVLYELLNEEEQNRLVEKRNLDKSFSAGEIGSFRLNIFFNRKGIAAVLRSIPNRIPTLADLALPQVCEKLCALEKGLVLVTGPTGSGKSTTLAAMINHINQTSKTHILTVEDPVEFVHQSQNSLVNQREIGSSCHSFADALKYALREDPDVILIGEMRDLETIALALTAAETGHLVFGTLHTRGAAASVDRIIDSFPSNQQAMIRTMLAESLKAVISQSLFKHSSGKGRVAAHEIMVVNSAISNLIREGKTFQIPSSIQIGRKEGMITMDQSIMELVTKEFLNPEDCIAAMENPALLDAVIKKMPKRNSKNFQSAPVNPPTEAKPPVRVPGNELKEQKVAPSRATSSPMPPKMPALPAKPASGTVQPPAVKLKSTPNPVPNKPESSTNEFSLQSSFKSLLDEVDELSDSSDELDILDEQKKKTG